MLFTKSARGHSRYSFLNLIDATAMDDDNLSLSLNTQAGNLSSILEEIDQVRIQALIRHTPEYEKTRFAILGSLLKCKDWPSFIPQETWTTLEDNMHTRFGLVNYPDSAATDVALRKFWAIGPDIEISAPLRGDLVSEAEAKKNCLIDLVQIHFIFGCKLIL